MWWKGVRRRAGSLPKITCMKWQEVQSAPWKRFADCSFSSFGSVESWDKIMKRKVFWWNIFNLYDLISDTFIRRNRDMIQECDCSFCRATNPILPISPWFITYSIIIYILPCRVQHRVEYSRALRQINADIYFMSNYWGGTGAQRMQLWKSASSQRGTHQTALEVQPAAWVQV